LILHTPITGPTTGHNLLLLYNIPYVEFSEFGLQQNVHVNPNVATKGLTTEPHKYLISDEIRIFRLFKNITGSALKNLSY
jgi:hypothetical protein